MKRRLSYGEAAAELKVSESWLRGNIKRLPHGKLGRSVYFTDSDLERIDELFHREPERGPLAVVKPIPATAGAHPLAGLKPLPARRTAP